MSANLGDEITNSMRQKTTEELLAIWVKNNRVEWSDAAFDAVRQVLAERGAAAPPLEARVAEHKFKGVEGWLLLFCIALTILGPILTLSSIERTLNANAPFYQRYPGLAITTAIDTLLRLGITALSIYAGSCLWRVRAGALATAQRFLWCYLAYQVLGSALPFMAGLPASANDAMVPGAVIAVLRGIVFFSVWSLYLVKSERVKATYVSVP